MKRQVFKDYQPEQSFLLPPDISEMIPEGHLVRIVNKMIDGIDRSMLEAQYKGGGTSAYDPQMLLKVIIYAYTQRIFTSRQIAKALRENVNFMWLSAMNRPNFRTINSISKTDPDATFMRMKEDAMRNGQLKAGYNVQLGTQNQYILGYSLHQRPGDTVCMQAHLEKLYEHMGRYPKDLIADAGYGSEENYAWLQEKNIEAYVKYNSFHYERKRHYKKKHPYRADAFIYHAQEDEYECPEGKRLRFEKEAIRRTENGYESKRKIYRCDDCSACPVREQCCKGKGNRQITIGAELEKYRQLASDRLESEKGRRYRSKRSVEVEAVFGRLKQNWGFRRFILRGIENVSTEWGILSVAHNIAKVAA